jgi:predicted RND superfamily exporter protein
MKKWVAWPARHPSLALSLALLLIIASLLSIRRIHTSASLETMISQDDPAARAAVRVLNDFPAAEELLVLATIPANNTTTPPDIRPLITFANDLEEAIRAAPNSATLCGDITYRAGPQFTNYFAKVVAPNGLYYLDPKSFQAAKTRLTREQMQQQFSRNLALISTPGPGASALAKEFLKDPLRLIEFAMDRFTASRPFKGFPGTDAFISANGRSILIRIAGKKPPSDLEAANAMTTLVTTLANRINSSGLELDVSGSYAIAAASQRAIRADMISSVISSILFLAALFVIAYRRPMRLFIIGFIPVAAGVLYGFGVYSLLLTDLTPLTAVIGGILAGMGIDYSIQYISHYQTSRQLGSTPIQAAEHTVDSLGSALLAAWVTSIVGFVVIGSSKVQALRDFAVLGSLGLTGAFIGSLFILPALLSLTSRAKSATTVPSPRLNLAPTLHWIRTHRTLCVSSCLIVLIAAAVVVIAKGSFLELESDLSVMHPQPNAPLEAQARITQRMGASPGSLIVYLTADSPETLIDLSHRVHERLATDSAKSAGIAGTYGLATLLPDPSIIKERQSAIKPAEVNRIIQDFRDVVAQSPFNPEAFDKYITYLRHLLTPTAPPTINDLLKNPDLAKTVLSRDAVSRKSLPTQAITLVFLNRPVEDAQSRAAVINTIRQSLKDLPTATLTGLTVIGNDMQAGIQADLPRLTLLALAIVLAYLFIQLRNLREPLLALTPTIFSLLLTLAFMHLLGRKLNMINLVTIPLLIGIDVDYAVFIVSAARLRRRSSPDVFEAQLVSSCHAIIMCAATTILGFGSLIFMSVPAVRSLGLAVAVGVLTALLATLFCLLPLVAPLATAVASQTDITPAPPEKDASQVP